MTWSDGRPGRFDSRVIVTTVNPSFMLSRLFGAAWGHFIPRYFTANSYQVSVDFRSTRESGNPFSVSNGSPSRAAESGFDRRLSASTLVRKVSEKGRLSTNQRTSYETFLVGRLRFSQIRTLWDFMPPPFPGHVLGDLGEGHPGMPPEFSLGQSGTFGDLAAQVGGEPGPQRPGVCVPQHRALVVVPLRSERRTQLRRVLVMADTAAAPPGVRPVVHRAERRSREGGEHSRMHGHPAPERPCRRAAPP